MRIAVSANKPDVLLVYWVSEETQTLYLERIGSQPELFR